MMDRFVLLLFGLNVNLYQELPTQDKRAYKIKAVAYVFALMVSSVVGLELAMTAFNLTGVWVGIATLGYLCFVGIFDWLLIRRAIRKFFRIGFSLGIGLLSTACALSLIAKNDVQQKLSEQSKMKLELLDQNYEAARTSRYRAVSELEEEQRRNHEDMCVPESKQYYAGPRYAKKHAYCDSVVAVAQRLKAQLDTQEQEYAESYKQERAILLEAVQAPSTAGLFDAVRQAWEVVTSSWEKMVVGIIAFIIILILELALVGIKVDHSMMDEFEAKEAELCKQLVLRRMEGEYEAQIEYERQMNSGRLRRLKFEDSQRQSMEVFKSNLDALMLTTHIKTQYDLLKKDIAIPQDTALLFENLIKKQFADLAVADKDEGEPKTKTVEPKSEMKFKGIGTEALSYAEVLKAYYQNTLFLLSEPMKQLSRELWQEAGNAEAYAKTLFNWSVEHLTYNCSHDQQHYSTAREVFNNRLGVCGEMGVFVVAMLRHQKLDAAYAHVTIDANGAAVNHACAALNLGEKTILIDVAYKGYDIKHQEWKLQTDQELSQHYIGWNK